MANFLRDYINHRGENTVIRTIYGIIDKVTGEHLVPVQHADRYFSTSEVVEIFNVPNQGYVLTENPNGEKPNPPVWSFTSVNGIPVVGETVDVDASASTTEVLGSYSIPDSPGAVLQDTFMNVDGADEPLHFQSPGNWNWNKSFIQSGETKVITVKGKAKNEFCESTESSKSISLRGWGAMQWTTDLDSTEVVEEVGYSTTLTVKFDTTTSPSGMKYQWYKDGEKLTGKTNLSLVLNDMIVSDSGEYYCVATDKLNRTLSSTKKKIRIFGVLRLTSEMPPVLEMKQNESTTLKMVATGGVPSYVFSWAKGTSSVSHENPWTLTPDIELFDGDVITASVTDTRNVTYTDPTNGVVTITPLAPVLRIVSINNITPTGSPIDVQVDKPIILKGSFSDITASGTFQTLNANINAGNSVIPITTIEYNDFGDGSFELSIPAGTFVSGAGTVFVEGIAQNGQKNRFSDKGNSSIVNVNGYVSTDFKITTDLSGDPVTVTAGETQAFGPVEAQGGLNPYRYQWMKNGADVSGATSNTLTINPTSVADSGDYKCVIKDGFNTTVETKTISLTVNA